MERYNPFAAESSASPLTDDIDPFSNNPIRRQLSSSLSATQGDTKRGVTILDSPKRAESQRQQRQESIASIGTSSRYSTSFPDPFGEDGEPAQAAPQPPPPPPLSPLHSRLVTAQSSALSPRGSPPSHQQTFAPLPPVQSAAPGPAATSNRSNSVTFLHKIDYDAPQLDKSSLVAQKSATPTHSSSRHPIQRGATTTRSHTGASGFGSFLSRATSVTSSSVTDRVSGAVGSVRGAVDSLSSQFQQAGLGGERPSSASTGASTSMAANATNLFASPGGADKSPIQQQQQQQQSTASYLASKLSSATNQFVGAASGSSSQSGSLMPLICRQRVVLILDSVPATDWAHQFNQYRRLVSGLGPASSSTSSAFTSFFSSQFSSVSGSSDRYQAGAAGDVGADLIEQTDFTDISVLANQSSSTATVYVTGQSALGTASSMQQASTTGSRLSMSIGGGSGLGTGTGTGSSALSAAKIIRPEYVVVRQRGKEKLDHLRGVVKALNYCLVPMFEPYEIWNVFQDRQLIFAKLLRVQKQLGKQNFPLIPQIYCQTHQDLLNYINNSSITLPCLVRTGQLGKGKIKIDNLQMLKDFATIMATSEQSCTIEQFLDVKCDLIVQRLGTSLKLFKGNTSARKDSGNVPTSGVATTATGMLLSGSSASSSRQTMGASEQIDSGGQFEDQFGQRQSSVAQQLKDLAASGSGTPPSSGAGRQSASRQTSLGSGVLSSLISTTSSGLQQVTLGRRVSNPSASSPCAFEKMADVNGRYREWIEAIAREFDNKIDAFCIKIVVASNDREYIVGLRNCSMDFLGNQENQDEDRRSFVELVITKMNTVLPKHQPVSRESSAMQAGSTPNDGQTGASSNQAQQSGTSRPYAGVKRTSSDDQNQQAAGRGSNQVGGSGASLDKKNTTLVGKADMAGGAAQSNGVGQGLLSGARYSHELASSTNRVNAYAAGSSSGQLNNRSRSVSMNQADTIRSSGGGGFSAASVGGGMPLAATNGAPLNKSSGYYFRRRSSDRTDSLLTNDDNERDDITGSSGQTGTFSQTPGSSVASSAGAGLTNQRQLSLSQSIFDQTSTAFSSFQKQSLSFLKRLDSRTGADLIGGGGSNTPPQSAKSDTAFDRNFALSSASTSALARAESSAPPATGAAGSPFSSSGEQTQLQATNGSSILTRPGVKSQSIDAATSCLAAGSGAGAGLQRVDRGPPPKPPPPPPQTLLNRQSSLASYSSANRQQLLARQRQDSAPRQNSAVGPTSGTGDSAESLASAKMASSSAAGTGSAGAANQQRQTRVVRQNSALSAFEPFDPDLRSEIRVEQQQNVVGESGSSLASTPSSALEGRLAQQQQQQEQQRSSVELAPGKKRPISEPYDTVSVNSGNSNSTDETTTAEDTMNNLKKTFASIFGDKCE